jgi:hypothetical protein
MCATLDGRVRQTGAVFEAKFMLPWNFSAEGAAEKHMAQLQHNMWGTAAARRCSPSSPEAAYGSRSPIPADPHVSAPLLTEEVFEFR